MIRGVVACWKASQKNASSPNGSGDSGSSWSNKKNANRSAASGSSSLVTCGVLIIWRESSHVVLVFVLL